MLFFSLALSTEKKNSETQRNTAYRNSLDCMSELLESPFVSPFKDSHITGKEQRFHFGVPQKPKYRC